MKRVVTGQRSSKGKPLPPKVAKARTVRVAKGKAPRVASPKVGRSVKLRVSGIPKVRTYSLGELRTYRLADLKTGELTTIPLGRSKLRVDIGALEPAREFRPLTKTQLGYRVVYKQARGVATFAVATPKRTKEKDPEETDWPGPLLSGVKGRIK